MSKKFDKVFPKTLNILAYKSINTFIETINFRILYFLFIEFRLHLRKIEYIWKKKTTLKPLRVRVDVLDAFYHFHEMNDLNLKLKSSNCEGHNADKTGKEEIQVTSLEIIEQIKPEE